MRLVGYLRVSTDRQAEEGLGLEVQEAAIRDWSRTHGHRVTTWARDEGASGANGVETRVGLLSALSAVSEGSVAGLVVYRLDRLARDLVLQEQLLAEVWRGGARVFSTSPGEDAYLAPDDETDPSRALIRQILGAVAQYERALIRLRLRSGKQRKAALGGYVGGAPPFGYAAANGTLVPAESEIRTVERAVELRGHGRSLREIASTLEAEGHVSKRGGRWHPETVRQLVARAQAV